MVSGVHIPERIQVAVEILNRQTDQLYNNQTRKKNMKPKKLTLKEVENLKEEKEYELEKWEKYKKDALYIRTEKNAFMYNTFVNLCDNLEKEIQELREIIAEKTGYENMKPITITLQNVHEIAKYIAKDGYKFTIYHSGRETIDDKIEYCTANFGTSYSKKIRLEVSALHHPRLPRYYHDVTKIIVEKGDIVEEGDENAGI